MKPANSTDIDKRYVRVRDRHDGFVEFDFAIGDPELFVELILSDEAFEEFCRENAVQRLDEDAGETPEIQQQTWRLGDVQSHDD